MEFAGILLVLVIWLIQFAVKQKKQDKDQPAAEQRARVSPNPNPVPEEKVPEKRREQLARVEQWHAAKAQQDDARQVHSINMDSCENRLESLKTLYAAGILDREEYAQRVARVKAQHAHGTGK